MNLELKGGSFNIIIKTLTGLAHATEVESNTTVEELKERLQCELGIPAECQRFIYAGKCVYEPHTLGDFGI